MGFGGALQLFRRWVLWLTLVPEDIGEKESLLLGEDVNTLLAAVDSVEARDGLRLIGGRVSYAGGRVS